MLKPESSNGAARLWVAGLVMLAALGTGAARAADGGLSVQLGPARLRLIEPAGLIPIDGLDPNVDELLAGLKAPGAEILAVYAEPRSWREYKKGINLEGPRVPLDFYAYIATPLLPPGELVSQEDFERFKELTLRYGGEMKVLDDQPRYLTYEVTATRIGDDGRKFRSDQITTLILVEGKILALNTFSNDLNRVPSQFRPSALGWRDAYWKTTRP
ncbi:MAG: hypothetical protein LBV70_00730 [Candidatus Adiutrix sp.]|nr:hypothetical protein [Candidatus Adiutrix sp.]